jgi:hypothetical protein
MAVLARLPTLLDRRIGFRFLDRTGAWDGDLPAPFSQGTDWERYGGDYGMATVQDGPNAGSRSIECWIRGDNVDSGIGGYPNNRCEMPIDLDVSAGSVRYIGMDIWINAANQGYWQSCTQLKDGSYEGQGIGGVSLFAGADRLYLGSGNGLAIPNVLAPVTPYLRQWHRLIWGFYVHRTDGWMSAWWDGVEVLPPYRWNSYGGVGATTYGGPMRHKLGIYRGPGPAEMRVRYANVIWATTPQEAGLTLGGGSSPVGLPPEPAWVATGGIGKNAAGRATVQVGCAAMPSPQSGDGYIFHRDGVVLAGTPDAITSQKTPLASAAFTDPDAGAFTTPPVRRTYTASYGQPGRYGPWKQPPVAIDLVDPTPDTTPPAPPTGTPRRIAQTPTSVQIAWDQYGGSPDFDHFILERSTGFGT